MKKILITAFTLLSFNAFADQCQYVTTASAETAVKLLSISKKNSGDALFLCQNCGDKIPEEVQLNKVEIGFTNVSDVPSVVIVNGSQIDLAYTYVNVHGDTYVNLGKLSNCANDGTSQFIVRKKSVNGSINYKVGPIL